MDNGKVMTALELAVKQCNHDQAKLHNDKGAINCKNSMNLWSILSDYLSMCTSSIADVIIYIIRFVRTISVVYFNDVFTANVSYNLATTSPCFVIHSISINLPNYCGHFAPLLVKLHCLLAFICQLELWIISAIFTNDLICADNATNKNSGHSTTTKNYNIFT